MCHTTASPHFPLPSPTGELTGDVEALVFGAADAARRIAVIPDIYGLTPFYQGFATHIASKNAQVFLVNPFAGLGELPEVTREAAFARRHRVADKAFVDAFEQFCTTQGINGVVGFCLGGYYVFELARRAVPQNLVGFYGFPQGMDNRDPLPQPFAYLGDIDKSHTSLMPGQDQAVGTENVARLARIADSNAGIKLHVYEASGHGFLTDLDSDNNVLRGNAQQALAQCELGLGL